MLHGIWLVIELGQEIKPRNNEGAVFTNSWTAIQFMILKVWDFQDHVFYLLAHEWINISFQVHELHLEVHELINLWNFMNCYTIYELWVHEFKFMNIFKFINLNKFMKFMKLFYRGCILGFASDNLYFVHTQAASNGCKRTLWKKNLYGIYYISKQI